MVCVAAPRSGTALGAPGVGDRRARGRTGHQATHRVEGVEHRVELGVEAREGVGLGEGQLQVGAGEPETAAGEAFGELGTHAEESHRSEIDAAVAGGGHLIEDEGGLRH